MRTYLPLVQLPHASELPVPLLVHFQELRRANVANQPRTLAHLEMWTKQGHFWGLLIVWKPRVKIVVP